MASTITKAECDACQQRPLLWVVGWNEDGTPDVRRADRHSTYAATRIVRVGVDLFHLAQDRDDRRSKLKLVPIDESTPAVKCRACATWHPIPWDAINAATRAS